MSAGRVVRSVSFPAEDLESLELLASRFGGFSALFQFTYKSLLEFKRVNGREPTKSELAEHVHAKKARLAQEAEATARQLREEHERLHADAVRMREAAENARIEQERLADAARAQSAPTDAPEPATCEEWIEHDSAILRRLHPNDRPKAEARLREAARRRGEAADEYLLRVRQTAGLGAQTTLHVLPTPKETRQ